ncbi:hypothetical protein WMF45_23290 [Sorangium sp. So ce448]|uniref:hypothetical protein n=1 Tax=Sorangium sp. So ce448 TaxID=3133314 RepID=UPI003F642538
MIIWVDDRLFQEGARDVDRLALLRGAAIRRHTLIISSEPTDLRADRISPGFDSWKNGLPERLRREVEILCLRLELVSGNATARGAERLLVSGRAPLTGIYGCWVTMEEAVRAVVLPTYVLVENAINDRAFLRRAMHPAWRERLDTWERAGLLRYENGGGNSMMRVIIEFHGNNDNARQAFGLPSELWRLVHVIVYDHDGIAADYPGSESGRVERACRDAGLTDRSHRLHRRDQEHYLPREALEEIVQQRVSNDGDRDKLMMEIAAHMAKGERRHFDSLPKFAGFKNAFNEPLAWREEWFQRDGSWPEMTLLAEKIAAAI